MAAAAKKTKAPLLAKDKYACFDQINGEHPWQKIMPEGCINYPARELNSGEIAYFNFDLAMEMGLIATDHPRRMNATLAKKIIKTFGLRIINEFDQQQRTKFKPSLVKPNFYMATRYVQLQHKNKQGRTSGDGRGIWNGVFEHKGKIWDVSSRGTGVTALAPGAVLAGKPLESGSTDFGYGCGLAEIDELYSAAIMAEILHRRGINTERVLAIIDIGDGLGIGVRAGLNLFRPAHLFVYLKQDNLEALTRATDFLIRRQAKNRVWPFGVTAVDRYDQLLEQLCNDFARFAAVLEREYIFAWLDWDGDNVLLDAGIIDYGSIRQFGLRHDQYRYDDVERWSTNLNEQKQKAKLIIQTFAQLVDYLNTGKRRPITEFHDHPALRKFEETFQAKIIEYFLFQIGFTKPQAQYLVQNHQKQVEIFYSIFVNFERAKVTSTEQEVEDGVNKPALYNMRRLLGRIPNALLNSKDAIAVSELRHLMLAEDLETLPELTKYQYKKLEEFQEAYIEIITHSGPQKNFRTQLRAVKPRAEMINREDRITGNGLIFVVEHLMAEKKKGLDHTAIQKIIDELIHQQDSNPTLESLPKVEPDNLPSAKAQKVMSEILDMVEECKETI